MRFKLRWVEDKFLTYVNDDFTVDVKINGKVETYPLIALYGEIWVSFRCLTPETMRE